MTTATLPALSGFTTHYGIPVCYVGEDGTLIALGHHDERTTIAAMNREARTTCGLVNIVDDCGATYADVRECLSRTWAVQIDAPEGHDDHEWWISWGLPQGHPGAFPVMAWGRCDAMLLRTLDQIRADRTPLPDPGARRLLAAVHRWARTNGWQPTLSCWSNRDRRIDVSWDDDQVSVFTDGHAWPVTYKATTVRQAIDHLVVAGVLPAEFSTQYEAGRRAA